MFHCGAPERRRLPLSCSAQDRNLFPECGVTGEAVGRERRWPAIPVTVGHTLSTPLRPKGGPFLPAHLDLPAPHPAVPPAQDLSLELSLSSAVLVVRELLPPSDLGLALQS